MKLLIDIPENLYQEIMDNADEIQENGCVFDRAIINGAPLTEVVAKIKALDTDCHVVYAVAIDDVLKVFEEYQKGGK